jgi:hypothetical protein
MSVSLLDTALLCVPVAPDNQLIAEEVAQAQATVKDANAGLRWFQLKPEGVIGQCLLEHMFMKRHICYKTRAKDLCAPNAYLDVDMLPGKL